MTKCLVKIKVVHLSLITDDLLTSSWYAYITFAVWRSWTWTPEFSSCQHQPAQQDFVRNNIRLTISWLPCSHCRYMVLYLYMALILLLHCWYWVYSSSGWFHQLQVCCYWLHNPTQKSYIQPGCLFLQSITSIEFSIRAFPSYHPFNAAVSIIDIFAHLQFILQLAMCSLLPTSPHMHGSFHLFEAALFAKNSRFFHRLACLVV